MAEPENSRKPLKKGLTFFFEPYMFGAKPPLCVISYNSLRS